MSSEALYDVASLDSEQDISRIVLVSASGMALVVVSVASFPIIDPEKLTK